MKLSSIFKKAGIAAVFLLTAQVAQAGIPIPPPVTVTLGGEVLAGPFAGTMGSGLFTYDPAFLDEFASEIVSLGPPAGIELPGLLDFEFTIFDQTFTMDHDIDFPDYPVVDFAGLDPFSLNFLVVDMSPVDIVQAGVQEISLFGSLSGDPIGGGPIGPAEVFDYYTEVTIVSAVPVPPALWLFGSGLLGLAGMARRKKA